MGSGEAVMLHVNDAVRLKPIGDSSATDEGFVEGIVYRVTGGDTWIEPHSPVLITIDGVLVDASLFERCDK